MEYQKPSLCLRRISQRLTVSFELKITKRNHNSPILLLHNLDGPSWSDHLGVQWYKDGHNHRLDGPAWDGVVTEHYVHGLWNHESTKDIPLHYETIKLGSINQFIDFVARCDIILL